MSVNNPKYSKRKLDFLDKPFNGKLFYIDIKAETAKRKIVRRIKDLGGNVEGFLSKDIDLFITDKKWGDLERASSPEEVSKPIQISNNLSRGRALLMKANVTSNNSRRTSTSGNDIVRNAVNLGVKVEQASVFLRDSNKFVNGLKKAKKTTNEIDGVCPLEWAENEKENKCYVKVEDTEQSYKPLLKHFDNLPNLYYNDEVASPFVKGVVLTKQTDKNVNRYSTAKKTVSITNNGGYCEACYYWYRCSLREHIKSAKHEKFVKDQTNFEHLDMVISKLPSLSDFLFKLNHTLGNTHNVNTKEYQTFDDNLTKEKLQSTELVLQTKAHVESNNLSSEDHDKVSVDHEMDSLDQELQNEEIVTSLHPVQNETENTTLNIAMPSLSNELFAAKNSGLEQKETTKFLESEMSSCIVQTIETPDSEMPSLHKEQSYDTNTQDSGTGPDLPDSELINIELRSNDKSKIKQCNSDSALPPDEEVRPFGIDHPDDNAVFMDDIQQSTNVLVENITLNIRQKFSQISLVENGQEMPNITSYSHESNDTGLPNFDIFGSGKNRESACSYDFSSPNSKSQHQFNFHNLASNWIKDMGRIKDNDDKGQDTLENEELKESIENMNCDYSESTEELNPEEYKQLVNMNNVMSTEKCSNLCEGNVNDCGISRYNLDDSTENLTPEDFKFLSNKNLMVDSQNGCSQIEIRNSRQINERIFNLGEDSNSVDSISLISLPETPDTRNFANFSESRLSENSCSMQSFPCTPDNTLCASDSIGSTFDILSEKTLHQQRSAFDINCENSMSSVTKQEPIKIKINMSDIKKKEKAKRKVKVKRKIFPEKLNFEEKHNDPSYYQTQRQGEMKIRLCKVHKTPSQRNGDLMTYWKVRKSGGCRLVFSSEKRKATHMEHNHDNEDDKVSKRRKCIL